VEASQSDVGDVGTEIGVELFNESRFEQVR
jgi:hypothetical protein